MADMRRLTKKLFIILIMLALGFALVWIFFAWSAYERQFYSSDEVAATCDMLNLSPDSAFCRDTQRNNYQTLEAALEERYPVNQTTYEDLVADIDATLKYSSSTCNGLYNTEGNICPPPEQCTGEYICFVDVSEIVTRLWIKFDDDGRVTDYSVVTSNS